MYSFFIKERFERCLDLYLCPRSKKKRINVDPQSLVPKLPKPQDLQPFPTTLLLRYTGHTARVSGHLQLLLHTLFSGCWCCFCLYVLHQLRSHEVSCRRTCREHKALTTNCKAASCSDGAHFQALLFSGRAQLTLLAWQVLFCVEISVGNKCCHSRNACLVGSVVMLTGQQICRVSTIK